MQLLQPRFIAANLLSCFLLSAAAAALAQDQDADPADERQLIPYQSGILFESDNPDALLVQDVSPGSPAARARIQPGDTIVTVDDQTFAAAEDVEAYLTTLKGKPATVLVLRDGRERALIYANEIADVDTFPVPVPRYGQSAGIGIRIYKNLVIAVWEGSPADRAGILPGDRFIAVNDVEPRGTSAFVAAIASHPAGEPFDITLQRGDMQQDVIVETERWTLAFDEEPEYLEGWQDRVRRIGCYTYDDDALLDDDYVLERQSFESEFQALRAELERMRAELAETNNRLAELQNRVEASGSAVDRTAERN